MYNPWVVYDLAIDEYYFEDQLVFGKHPTDRFLTSDLITTKDNYSHMQGNIVKWNFAFLDGHVESRSEKTTTDPKAPRNIWACFLKLDVMGVSADAEWRWWGFNDPKNSWPMGQVQPYNGSIRYELLTKGSGG